MKLQGRTTVLVGILFIVLLVSGGVFVGQKTLLAASSPAVIEKSQQKWYRGQLHVHTNWYSIDQAVKWYKYHNYDFVVITDLNKPTLTDGVQALYGEPELQALKWPAGFLVLSGIEPNVEPRGKIFDSLGIGGDNRQVWEKWRSEIPGFKDVDRSAAAKILNRQAEIIRDAGGIPIGAHPNLAWSWTHEDLLKTDPSLLRHFELRNGEPGMNDTGGGGVPSTEEMWDRVLSTGRILYAVATDDSHHFEDFGSSDFFAGGGRYIQAKALPGRTSIWVAADQLTEEAVLKALDNGDFYTGIHYTSLPIQLESYEVDKSGIRIRLPFVTKDIGWTKHGSEDEQGQHQPGDNEVKYRTYFIGKDGKILKIDESRTPSYSFSPRDRVYVRARVEDSDGNIAWTQPVFLDS